MGKKVIILDSTLREGEQTPGVSFSVEQKLEIAQRLDEVGVDIIESGNPVVSKDVKEAMIKISELGLGAEVMGHARASIPDIQEVVDCGADSVGIFLGATDTRLKQQLRMSRERALEVAYETVKYAKDHGLKVRFTAEDGTRADPSFLEALFKSASEAGADRLSIADTVGIMTPGRMKALYEALSGSFDADFETHCHNDLGMAVANSLAAMEGGAKIIDVTVNGLGERAGIASLQEVAAALKVHYQIDTVKLGGLRALSMLVERYSGILLPPNAPLVGENAFSHKAGVHTAAVIINPSIYEGFPPELIARARELVVDKYAGKAVVRARLERLGVKLSDEQVSKVLEIIKGRPGVTRYRDVDLLDLAERVSGKRLKPVVPESIEALISVKCESNVYTSSVARKIGAVKGITRVYEVSGDYDVEAELTAGSMAELNECLESIREIKGIVGTNTKFVLKKFHGASGMEGAGPRGDGPKGA
jgi:2-isopropylmalate synthase